MKGTIVKCMEELVIEKFGAGNGRSRSRRQGSQRGESSQRFCDIDETEFTRIMTGVAEVTFLSMEQVMEAFGEHWSTVYAPNVYAAYYSGVKTSRELLVNLDHMHEVMTKSIKFARPPRFRYEWQGEQHLIMHYESGRGFVALMPGLIRGVGKYYKEDLTVSVVGNAVQVHFL